ncbi:hypothetical protein [Lysinibacillus sp. NPDC086135]|uniref:hypothetical protein n=1 Tax=Lysinibacillus sp. NPDC086135 TaxID=3364130 RepID=UPI0037FA4935
MGVLVSSFSNATTNEILERMELVNVVTSTLNLDPIVALELIKDWTDNGKQEIK